MQSVYSCIPETNPVSRVYRVAAVQVFNNLLYIIIIIIIIIIMLVTPVYPPEGY
jgi:hypothetical protein